MNTKDKVKRKYNIRRGRGNRTKKEKQVANQHFNSNYKV